MPVGKLTGLLIIFAAALAHPGIAHADCPSFPDPQVNINATFSPPRYNFQQNLAKLRQIAETKAAAILRKDQAVGLSVGELSMRLNMQANAAYGSDGRICAKPSQIDIDLGFQNNTVYVARELPRRTCGHEEVLAHEEGHVTIDRALLKEYEPIVIRYMQTAAREMGTVRAKTTAEAEQQMQAFINDHLEKVAAEINKERQLRQADHDSADEYRRLAAVCNGQIAQTVNTMAPAIERGTAQLNRRSAYGSYPSQYSAKVPSGTSSRSTYWGRDTQ